MDITIDNIIEGITVKRVEKHDDSMLTTNPYNEKEPITITENIEPEQHCDCGHF